MWDDMEGHCICGLKKETMFILIVVPSTSVTDGCFRRDDTVKVFNILKNNKKEMCQKTGNSKGGF